MPDGGRTVDMGTAQIRQQRSRNLRLALLLTLLALTFYGGFFLLMGLS